MRVIVTVTCANFLPKAVALAESCRRFEPHALRVCCVVEKTVPEYPRLDTFDHIWLARLLPFDDFERFVFRFSLVEAVTAIKAKLLLEILHRFPECDEVVYLDPDTLIYSPFFEVAAELSSHPILVTPHHLHDEPTWDGVADNMLRTLMCGTYNLGFIALRRDSESVRFLRWWHEKLCEFCFVDFSRGLFVDQKWIDIAIPLFDIGILRHPGYNVANWNISQRSLTSLGDGQITVAGYAPLRFFHYSSVDTGKDLRHLRRHARGGDFVFTLRAAYKQHLSELGQRPWGSQPWDYDFFDSGEVVLPAARVAYRRNSELRQQYPRPFDHSNEEFLAVGYPPAIGR